MTIIQPILLGGKKYTHGLTGKEVEGYHRRVLHPIEFIALRKAAKKYENQLRLDLELLTAGRYSELRELQWNKQWYEFDNNALHIKEHKVKRLERGVPERYIHLSNRGKSQVEAFLNHPNIRLSSYAAMWNNLARWAQKANIDPTGLTVKCFRKTYESWLIYIYPEKAISIFLSTGHTQKTAMEHYLNLPFTEEDKILMMEYVEGWQ